MSSTEQVRKWYHEGVVLNHANRGTPGFEPRCNHNHPTVAFPRSGGVFNEPVNPLCHEAFEAYAAVMRRMNVNMPGAGGVNHCRNIGTTDWPSLHAYLCAIDLPPNSFKSATFLAAILAIRTNSGARVFRNLSGDRMHDQIDCSPTALATGIDWSTVIGADMSENHPATSHRAFTRTHDTGTVPSWAPWEAYQKAGGSSIESSGTWAFTRADAAWYWRKWIVPLQKKTIKLEAEVTALKKRVTDLEMAPPSGVSEARVKELIAVTKLVP